LHVLKILAKLSIIVLRKKESVAKLPNYVTEDQRELLYIKVTSLVLDSLLPLDLSAEPLFCKMAQNSAVRQSINRYHSGGSRIFEGGGGGGAGLAEKIPDQPETKPPRDMFFPLFYFPF